MDSKFYKSKIKINILEKEEIQDIFYTSLDVMERVGVRVHNQEAIEIFKRNGCVVEEGNLVHIPSALALSGLRTVPERITLFNRIGEPAMLLEGRRTYYGSCSDCTNIIDSYTSERRQTTSADLASCARIIDSLPGIDFCESTVLAQDLPAEDRYVNQYLVMTENTTKPTLLTVSNAKDVDKIYNIASIIVGGKDNFKKRPTLIIYSQPNSPLYHTNEAIEKLLYCAKNDIPIVYTPCPISGATAPVTKAGTLVIALCETLSGIILTQLINPGTRVIMGTTISIFDMSTMIMPYGNPELQIMSAALCEIAQFLKIPVFTTAGCTDAKVLDEQAAIEITDTLLMAALSGGNLIHDSGYMESGMTTCFEILIMCNEVIMKIKKMLEGIVVNETTLMRETIGKIGPGGNFLTDESTAKFYKKEFYFPKLFSRDSYSAWKQKGSKPFGKILNEKAVEILENHEVQKLDNKTKGDIDKILGKK
ncbi:MAG: trimethylamine methyltransferase family protein [Actinobacteria bacterium]|nr:trimethylamine methyltransferase family protein [Actinomycetota bacterium]